MPRFFARLIIVTPISPAMMLLRHGLARLLSPFFFIDYSLLRRRRRLISPRLRFIFDAFLLMLPPLMPCIRRARYYAISRLLLLPPP